MGLISEDRYQKFLEKMRTIDSEIVRVSSVHVGASDSVQKLLKDCGSAALTSGISLRELICRPELSYKILSVIDKSRTAFPKELEEEIEEQVNIRIKYEGYIKRQLRQVEQFKKLEDKKIPEDIDYDEVKSLRIEAVQKLKELRPISIGQASRISGVSPADISVLLVYLGGKQ